MTLPKAVLQTLDPQVRTYIAELEDRATGVDQRWERKYHTLEARYQALEERHRLLLYKRFSRSSEQEPADQHQLFTEAEDTADPGDSRAEANETTDTITVAGHERAKAGRKPIDAKHPRVEVVHDIPDEDKACGCGATLVRIGEEVREVAHVIPEQIWVERHRYPKYACHTCEGSGDEDKPAVRIAAREPVMFPRSIVTPSLLAFVLVNKYVDHLPFYRQEKRFERIGFHISRQDMSNWTIAAAGRVKPLLDRFETMIRGGPLIQMDETPLQVMNEPERKNTTKSYMWLARGGPPQVPIVLYHYRPTRGDEYPRCFLSGFEGHLQTDGYAVYRKLSQELPFTLVGCWAHARRKFFEAGKAAKTGAAHEALGYINKLYQIERKLRSDSELTPEKFSKKRRTEVEPVLTRFLSWLNQKKETVPPSTLLGGAVKYTLGEWDVLVRYLDRPEITPDNNAAENSIRPFVLGRRNWMFSGSPRGAESSCAIYSLIETARQNGLDPFAKVFVNDRNQSYFRERREQRVTIPRIKESRFHIALGFSCTQFTKRQQLSRSNITISSAEWHKALSGEPA